MPKVNIQGSWDDVYRNNPTNKLPWYTKELDIDVRKELKKLKIRKGNFLDLEKFNVMFSVSLSSPPEPPIEMLVTIRLVIVIFLNSIGVSPAFLTTSIASSKCSPLAACNRSIGDVLSMNFVKLMS